MIKHIPFLCTLLAASLTTAIIFAEDHRHTNAEEEHGQHAERHDIELPKEAVAVLFPTRGNEGIRGVVTFTEHEDHTHIQGRVIGLPPGPAKHGFHIHEFGDMRSPDGESAGGHFEGGVEKHGGPGDEHHHYGDLGNIETDEEGVAIIDIKADWMKVHFILGRGLIVHEGEDDLTTQPTGDAGPRVAVGVIGVAQPEASENE